MRARHRSWRDEGADGAASRGASSLQQQPSGPVDAPQVAWMSADRGAPSPPGGIEPSSQLNAIDRDDGSAMPTYIMLSKLTPEGTQTIKTNPQRIREVNREIEQLGATVKAQWAVLGRFDFVNVVEAPDEKTIARVSLELGSRGTVQYETLTAIPIDDFISSL
jgi:uncharacterized protein with GYD domain